MKTAIITLKIEPKIKKEAQKAAQEFGMSLSSLVSGFLRDFIFNREVRFSRKEETPSQYLIDAIVEAEQNRKDGLVSPGFDNAKDAVAWLNDPKRKYVRDLQ